MKCFTDEQLDLGIEAVRDFQAFGLMTDADWRQVFLDAAQVPAVVHPMACARCGRNLTTEQGITLLAMAVREGRWWCAACAP
jgi:hypothetical protein